MRHFDKFSQQDKAARAVTTLDVLYEDADVLLINKPAGMLSQPDDTKGTFDGRVCDRLSSGEGRAYRGRPADVAARLSATVLTRIRAASSRQASLWQAFRNFQNYSTTGQYIRNTSVL